MPKSSNRGQGMTTRSNSTTSAVSPVLFLITDFIGNERRASGGFHRTPRSSEKSAKHPRRKRCIGLIPIGIESRRLRMSAMGGFLPFEEKAVDDGAPTHAALTSGE
jgi:hypothetical protein